MFYSRIQYRILNFFKTTHLSFCILRTLLFVLGLSVILENFIPLVAYAHPGAEPISEKSDNKYPSSPASLWLKKLEGPGDNKVDQTIPSGDGGFILVGNAGSHGYYKVLVTKLNSNGDEVWSKLIPGYGVRSSITQIKNSGTLNGYAIVSGSTVTKIDLQGNLQWCKVVRGGETYYHSYLHSIAQTDDEGFILGGFTYITSVGGKTDFIAIKLDLNGDKEWSKFVHRDLYDTGEFIIQTIDGGYAIVGTTEDDYDLNDWGRPIKKILVAKLTSEGDLDWTTMLRDELEDSDNNGKNISQSHNGNLIVSGTHRDDLFISQLDLHNGDVLFTHRTTQSIHHEWGEDRGYDAIETKDGGYILAGLTNFGYYSYLPEECRRSGGGLIVKLDKETNLKWAKVICNADTGAQIKNIMQLEDGKYVFGGHSSNDFLVAKFDADGCIGDCENIINVTTGTEIKTGPIMVDDETEVWVADMSIEDSTCTITDTSLVEEVLCYYTGQPLTVLTPNGGETLIGSRGLRNHQESIPPSYGDVAKYKISWKMDTLEDPNAKISIWLEDSRVRTGQPYLIAKNLPVSQTSYLWTIGEITKPHYNMLYFKRFVRPGRSNFKVIVKIQGSTISDKSDDYFSIFYRNFITGYLK